MGWQLYIESTDGRFPDAATYWSEVDPYRASASELYIRMPWSAFEPTEGHYAWADDANFIALVNGARARGLKLGFRIVNDSQDFTRQATPQYVFDDGAAKAPVLSDTDFPDPVLTDPVYRQKFTTFLTAFAARFNDAATTDFIDTTALGWWGEGSHLQLPTADIAPTLNWATRLYSRLFDRIIVPLNYGGEFGTANQDAAITANGLAIRRDSLGSKVWFPPADQNAIKAHFPASPVFGENCYQNFVLRPTTSCDGALATDGLRTVLTRVVSDAENVHANTLDLRWPATDLPSWVRDNPGLVHDFALNGGYRLAPDQVTYPAVTAGKPVTVAAQWSNTGVGVLPNDLPGWNHKYRVAYALLDKRTGRPAYSVLSESDPAGWLKGTAYNDRTTFAPVGLRSDSYYFATAIVDRTQGWQPGLNLATTARTLNGWTVLGTTKVKHSSTDTALQRSATATLGGAQQGPGDALISRSGHQGITVQPGAPTAVRLAWKQQSAIDEVALAGPGNQRMKVSIDTFDGHQWTPVLIDTAARTNHPIRLGTTVAASRLRITLDAPSPLRLTQLTVTGVEGQEPAIPVIPGRPEIQTGLPTAAGSLSAQAIADGDPTTEWHAAAHPALPSTLTMTWPDMEVPLSGITLVCDYCQEQGVTGLDLDYWDGLRWQPLRHGATLSWDHDDWTLEAKSIAFDTVNTTRLRVTVTEAAADGANGIGVSEIYPGPAPALPATAPPLPTATTDMATLDGSLPVSVISDGDTGTPWQSATDVTLPGTITLTWPKGRPSVNSLTIANVFAQGQAITGMDVDYWDGSAWQSIRHGVQLTWDHNDWTLETRRIDFDPVTTSSIRITVTSANRQWGDIAVSEITPGYAT
ncbi:hypothetical protein AB0M29_13520 [Streptomyces sp. NPDC051976]|uniref:hypothetical protein n=1 Tax=Streptomyces sp. NPDC051976 TaxID=3154947 RepID=UPI00344313F6